MLRQAQQLQKRMEKMQDELQVSTVETTSGGGVVKAKISGSMTIESLIIDPEVVDPDDVEMLQDLIVAAINDAQRKVDEAVAGKMGGMMGGLNIPGLNG